MRRRDAAHWRGARLLGQSEQYPGCSAKSLRQIPKGIKREHLQPRPVPARLSFPVNALESRSRRRTEGADSGARPARPERASLFVYQPPRPEEFACCLSVVSSAADTRDLSVSLSRGCFTCTCCQVPGYTDFVCASRWAAEPSDRVQGGVLTRTRRWQGWSEELWCPGLWKDCSSSLRQDAPVCV